MISTLPFPVVLLLLFVAGLVLGRFFDRVWVEPGSEERALGRQRAWAQKYLSGSEMRRLALAWKRQPPETMEWAHEILRSVISDGSTDWANFRGRPRGATAPSVDGPFGWLQRRLLSDQDGALACQALSCAFVAAGCRDTLPARAFDALCAPYLAVFGALPEIEMIEPSKSVSQAA